MVWQEAVEVVKEVEDPEESTKKLVGEAIKRGSADNITCVVVRFLESKNANTKADASSSQEIATNGQTVVTSDAEHNVSANETNQDHTAVLSDLDRNDENESLNQKPVAVTAAGRSVSSEQNGSAGKTNQVPSEIHRGSEPKSSSKQPSQGHITVHNNMDESVANQKPVIDEKKAIAATNTTSSEQSGSIGDNNQKPTAVHSDSATSKSSNVNSNH